MEAETRSSYQPPLGAFPHHSMQLSPKSSTSEVQADSMLCEVCKGCIVAGCCKLGQMRSDKYRMPVGV